jgi:alpha-beta hydrolase superfamily lysophospholipase
MRRLLALALAVVQPALAQSATPAPWKDPANHKSGFVDVARNVRLHYLDYGGVGPSVVFLPGLGNTAHAFDNFAPAFTDRFHVVALTRRGFGESSHPASGYDTPTRRRHSHRDREVAPGRVILIFTLSPAKR